MKLLPWEYLFISFNSAHFHDLFYPIVIASLVLMIVLLAVYNLRTRQLRHHPPYLELYEWLLWTGVITFSLLVIYAVFVFDFIFVLLTILIGTGTFLWIRFIRFPPVLELYEQKLAKQRYFTRFKYGKPEATIRTKGKRSRRRR